MKVKVFTSSSKLVLEQTINEFFANTNLGPGNIVHIDNKVQVISLLEYLYSVFIYYK